MQRIRTGQNILGSNLPSSTAQAIEQFNGFNMSAYKPANQVVSASTAIINDDSLWIELPTGPSRVTLILPLSLTAAGGLKLQMVADQGLTISTIRMAAIFLLDATAPSVGQIGSLGSPVNGGTTNAWTTCLVTGTVNVTNQGVLQLQWAQQAASGATTILAGAEMDSIQLTKG